MSFVEVKDVYKSFGKFKVLRGVNFTLNKCDQCVIQGASGSGKSTFLYLLGGLDQAQSGTIRIGKSDLRVMGEESLAAYRNSYCGFVFQFHFLLPSLNCLDNILLPARIGKHNLAEVTDFAFLLAKTLAVEECLKKYPFEISGGEQQRINIVRALSLRPKMLLCDEPTGNLDSYNSERVTNLLRDLSAEYKSILIIVTHDMQVADKFSLRLLMKDGAI